MTLKRMKFELDILGVYEFWWSDQVLHDPFDAPWRMLVVWTPWTPPGMPTAQALDQKRITYFRLKRVEYDGDLDQVTWLILVDFVFIWHQNFQIFNWTGAKTN